MKLISEIPYVMERFSKIKNLQEYAASLKANGDYKDFGIRLAWDCIHCSSPSEIVCGWYDKYNCNDTHITTLAKYVLREMEVLK